MAEAAASSSSVVELVTEAERDTASSAYFADGGTGAAVSWPGAEQTKSTLTSSYRLRQLCGRYDIPEEYTPLCAKDLAACDAPPISNSVCVYADALDAGMRLPLHHFELTFLRHYGLAPSQLAPNAWRCIFAFVEMCKDAGVEPLLSVFWHLFSLCTHEGDSRGHHHLKIRAVRLNDGRLVTLFTAGKMPSYSPQWKSKFFFLHAPPTMPWQCAVKWGRPTRKAVRRQLLTKTASAALKTLLERAANTGAVDIALFLAGREPPAGSLTRGPPVTPKQAEMKKERVDATVAAWTEQTRKRKLPESGAGTSTHPALQSDSGSELSAEQEWVNSVQKGVAELCGRLAQSGKDLQVSKGEVARLNEELGVSKGEVARLKEELRVATANAGQLKESLGAAQGQVGKLSEKLHEAKSEHHDELRAVKVEAQRELIRSVHLARSETNNGRLYAMGVRHTKQLAATLFRDAGVDLSELNVDDLPPEPLAFPPAPVGDHQ